MAQLDEKFAGRTADVQNAGGRRHFKCNAARQFPQPLTFCGMGPAIAMLVLVLGCLRVICGETRGFGNLVCIYESAATASDDHVSRQERNVVYGLKPLDE